MPKEVYMALGGDPDKKPETEMERLDKCWLNGGLALIRAFIKSSAEQNGFADVKVYSSPFHQDHRNMSLTIKFNTESVKGGRNARAQNIERGLRRFERNILDVNSALDRNLRKTENPEEVHYTMPLSRDYVPEVAGKIKETLARKIPVSAFITHLEGLKR